MCVIGRLRGFNQARGCAQELRLEHPLGDGDALIATSLSVGLCGLPNRCLFMDRQGNFFD
jgi:hypothetical protein